MSKCPHDGPAIFDVDIATPVFGPPHHRVLCTFCHRRLVGIPRPKWQPARRSGEQVCDGLPDNFEAWAVLETLTNA